MTTANSEERKKKKSVGRKKDLKYEEKIWQNAHNESEGFAVRGEASLIIVSERFG